MVQELKSLGPDKTIVGLTGIFGSGKSTVAHLFEELGAFVIDADRLAHEALLPGSELYESVARLFPECLERSGKGFNRKRLAGIVFSDEKRRKNLEGLIHPYVFQRMASEIADAPENIAVAEVPLLFESGFDRYCSPNVAVAASEEVILERMKERGFEPAEVKARWKAQMPLADKTAKADIVIDNSTTLNETKRQVEEVWKTRLLSRKE